MAIVKEQKLNLPLLLETKNIQVAEENKLQVNDTQMIFFEIQSLKLYIGEHKELVKSGRGLSVIISGENKGHIYDGQFYMGSYHGEGCYRWPNGDFY